jgi:hypothetical protein
VILSHTVSTIKWYDLLINITFLIEIQFPTGNHLLGCFLTSKQVQDYGHNFATLFELRLNTRNSGLIS